MLGGLAEKGDINAIRAFHKGLEPRRPQHAEHPAIERDITLQVAIAGLIPVNPGAPFAAGNSQLSGEAALSLLPDDSIIPADSGKARDPLHSTQS